MPLRCFLRFDGRWNVLPLHSISLAARLIAELRYATCDPAPGVAPQWLLRPAAFWLYLARPADSVVMWLSWIFKQDDEIAPEHYPR
jgi:hypothetical protein